MKLINEESFAAVDKRLREGHRITLVRASSGLRQLRHPVLNLLHNEDVITPLYYGYLILRKHAQTPQDLGYFLVQGTI